MEKLSPPHTKPAVALLEELKSTPNGLDETEAAARLERFGRNTLPEARVPGIATVFLHQFASPLIYVLIAAAGVSLFIGEHSDALFIGAVLLLNAVIGTVQEYSAQRAATALRQLVTTRSRVLRAGETLEVDAETLVPGDIVLLESGDRVPADLRLLSSYDLELDESLLTGESAAVFKQADVVLPADNNVADRVNMAFAGTLVNRGRGRGVVVATAMHTELGHIAAEVMGKPVTKAPLLLRMEAFTRRVALLIGIAALLMAGVALMRGMPLDEIFLLAVALAVSAIPEGLPVALTVALAISMRRMARRNVIVRRLLAVEALGSCTFIATDKTGTLTVNQLTVRQLVFADREAWQVTGESLQPDGAVLTPAGTPTAEEAALLERLCQASVLANEATLARRNHAWVQQGDAVDVALLVMAHKAGVTQAESQSAWPEIGRIAFESERLFAASLNCVDDRPVAFVKGALERLLPMCDRMASAEGDVALDAEQLERQAAELAGQGFRVIALAAGEIELGSEQVFSEEHLRELTLLGLVGMIDPLRPEAKAAVIDCRLAGIEVAMITGDHPATAYAIGNELELVDSPKQVVTGAQLKQADNEAELDHLTKRARVFAASSRNRSWPSSSPCSAMAILSPSAVTAPTTRRRYAPPRSASPWVKAAPMWPGKQRR